MDSKIIENNKIWIDEADRVIVTLHSGSKYIYDGIFQYKCHENGNWGYCDSYNSNYEYITHMYSIQTIEKIELLHSDSNQNRTIYE